MEKKDRDSLDDLFRSKLYDFESDCLPEDSWDKISGQLPRHYQLPSRNRWYYGIAAAVAALLLITGGFYFYSDDIVTPVVSDRIEKETEEIKSRMTEEEVKPVIAENVEPKQENTNTAVARATVRQSSSANNIAPMSLFTEEQTEMEKDSGIITEEEEKGPVYNEETVVKVIESPQDITILEEKTYIAEALPKDKTKNRRWNFGMGAGSITANSSNVTNNFNINGTKANVGFVQSHIDLDDASSSNTADVNNDLMLLNVGFLEKGEIPKTDIKHQTPISTGISASYSLADRWYLQAGLTYAYHSSSWMTNGDYHAKEVQNLHFVGLPVSILYKIAEWNNLMFYAYSGFKPEVNVSGRLRTTMYSDNQIIGREVENIRMKEWLWSVNAGGGVSYPLFRYVNAFAEVGAGYYFDNGSKIETIHSKKPLNLGLSFGLRLGF